MDDVTGQQLWRLRVTVPEAPGALERLTGALAGLGANILALHVHPLAEAACDDLVLAVPAGVSSLVLLDAVEAVGGRGAHVAPASPHELVDEPTRVLALAARVTEAPAELPAALAELLGARVDTGVKRAVDPGWDPGDRVLRVPSPWTGAFALVREDPPFTPAESARALRLAQLAAAALQRGERGPQQVGQAGAAGAEQGGVEVVEG